MVWLKVSDTILGYLKQLEAQKKVERVNEQGINDEAFIAWRLKL
ncbi:MAG: hypothetical protein Q7S16_03995 [bacterium]|nr:hypothetical protein [bacterium]